MTKEVVVVGIGGMGREILDLIEAMRTDGQDIEIAGVVDDRPSQVNLERLAKRGYRYLGTSDEALKNAEFSEYVVGIGSPAVRRIIAEKFDGAGWTAVTLVHPLSTCGSVTILKPGVVVCAGVRITTNVEINAHALLNLNVTVGHDTVIGAYTVANPGASISGDIHIGSDVLVGTGAVILQGLLIGTGATVGAAACVTKNVAPHSVVTGVPARPRETS